MPAYSFITCTYQSAKYIPRCYWSLRRQELEDWEWVLVDDGSTDETAAVVRTLSDPRVKYYQLAQNRGRAAARMFALERAAGTWAVLQDVDDLSFPDRLVRAEEARGRRCDFLCSAMALVDTDLRLMGVRGVKSSGYPKDFTHATICGDINIIRTIGYPNYPRAQDVKLVYTIANNYRGEFCDDPLYVYDQSANGRAIDALLGQFYYLKELNSLTASGALRATFAVKRMKLARIVKIIGLLPFVTCPTAYKYTVARRHNHGASLDAISTARRKFIDDCRVLFEAA